VVVRSHLIELPGQLILVDAQLTASYAAEVLDCAAGLAKPITRVYISHAHPDHFGGAGSIGAPVYALATVRARISQSGDLLLRRARMLTAGHDNGDIPARPSAIELIAQAGEEIIDGVRFSFEPVADAETSDPLTIRLPDERILIAEDISSSNRTPPNSRTWPSSLSWRPDTTIPAPDVPVRSRQFARSSSPGHSLTCRAVIL
jgi:glyoxylase-like metal-dependent hydrolase (beta-lactamase superfamily II)